MARVLKGTSKGVSGTTGKEVVVQVILERQVIARSSVEVVDESWKERLKSFFLP